MAAWSASILVHRLAFSEMFATPLGAASALTAALAALTPSSSRRFALALAASVAVALSRMPDVPNHFVFEVLVDGGMLVVLAPAVLRGDPPPARVAAIVRPALLALYGWAVVHKLNTDFLDPGVSCASYFAGTLRPWIDVLPDAPQVRAWSPWVALLLEGLVPVALAVRRLRWVAVLVGGAFHLLLIPHAISGVYSFSAAVLAAYCTFLPARWLAPVSRLAARLPGGTRTRELAAVVAVIAALVLAWSAHPIRVERLARAGMLVAATLTWLVVAREALRFRCDRGPSALPEGAVAGAVLALVVANGAMPYLGVKTQISFSMFSNLRTEVDGNHLFLPTWHLGGDRDHLVHVESASVPAIAEELTAPGVVVARYELQRRLARVDRPARVVYVDDQGARHEIDEAAGVGMDDPAREVPNAIARRLIRFRPVEPKGPMSCRH